MEQRGVVVKLDDGYAYVKIKRQSACGSNCASCAGCEVTERVSRVINAQNAKIGDHVRMEIKTKHIIMAAFLLYLMPLFLGFFVGITIFSLTLNDLLSVVSGIAIFAVAYLIIYILNRKLPKNDKFIGRITGIFS